MAQLELLHDAIGVSVLLIRAPEHSLAGPRFCPPRVEHGLGFIAVSGKSFMMQLPDLEVM